MNSCFKIKRLYCYCITKKQFVENESDIQVTIENFDEHRHLSLIKLRNEKVFKELLSISQKQKTIVACYKTNVIGHLCMKYSGDTSQGKCWRDKCFIHYGFVSPDFRGHNIYPMLLTYICNYFFMDSPNGKLYITTGQDNMAAQRSFEKIGFIKYAKQYEFFFLNHKFYYSNPY